MIQTDRGEFHAVLRKLEEGLYRAEYSAVLNPDDPDEREFPDFHLSTSIESVKVWVEQMAKGMGYTRVVWETAPSS